MRFLADVNLLFALVRERHQHNRTAIEWLGGVTESGSIGVCRVVQMGVLRLLTTKSMMLDDLQTPDQAWGVLTELMKDSRFEWLPEPMELDAAWAEILAERPASESANTDCYLAALAISTDLRLVSFDGGFRRFKRLRSEILG